MKSKGSKSYLKLVSLAPGARPTISRRWMFLLFETLQPQILWRFNTVYIIQCDDGKYWFACHLKKVTPSPLWSNPGAATTITSVLMWFNVRADCFSEFSSRIVFNWVYMYMKHIIKKKYLKPTPSYMWFIYSNITYIFRAVHYN